MHETIDKIRYVLALVILVTFPAAILFWVLIHPLARFWRRLGMVWTYTLTAAVGIGAMLWLAQYREPLLIVRYPFRWPLAVLGLAIYGIAIWIEVLCRKHLKKSVLVGAPELGGQPTPLLKEGIYARTRNPRYLNILIAGIGWALVINYPTIYWVAILMFPGIYLIIWLEERELLDRFGEEYEQYLRDVPRLWPRWG
ncbi:MAG: hypothetical protein OES47_10760 [Acidobacteriota bacterium]|nr:hypothetical protein [Acidobacteriota bacterium]